jgi:ribosomal protein S18 acetylase RimI-like enzyme
MSDRAIVRPARASDIAAVARLGAKLFRLHHDRNPQRYIAGDRIEDGYAWWLSRELARDDVVILVAAREDAIVGYTYGRLEERDWNQLLDAHGALHDVWVDEAERGTGLALQLVEATLEALLAKGAPRVVLHTAVWNSPAQALFAKLGFRQTMIEMTLEATDFSSRRRSV